MARILVVEDDLLIRESMVALFEDEGHAVDSAVDGQDALDWLTGGGAPDLILLDLMMPRVDGWEFLARRGEFPQLAGVPVIVVSGGLTDTTVPIEGAALVLKKPVSIDDLLDAVAALI